MSVYKTQPVRDKYKTPWQCEYIMGLIDSWGDMSTTRVLDMCESIMSRSTTHKFLMMCLSLQLLNQKRGDDKRECKFTPSARGVKFLEELKHACR